MDRNIRLFTKYLSAHHVPGAVLVTGERAMDKRNSNPCSLLREETDIHIPDKRTYSSQCNWNLLESSNIAITSHVYQRRSLYVGYPAGPQPTYSSFR